MLENFSTETAEKIFKPFLMKLSELREVTDRKIIAYLVAKDKNFVAELSKILEKISRENIQLTKIHSHGIEDFKFAEGFDEDNLLMKIRELKFDDEEAEIVLLAGDEILLKGNILVLADYAVTIQTEEKISALGNESWQLQGNNFVKLDDDEEDFLENAFES